MRATAIVYSEPLVDSPAVRAVRYRSPFDYAMIRSMQDSIESIPMTLLSDFGRPPRIAATTSADLITRLKRFVTPYGHQDVQLEINRVRVNTLVSLSKVVKAYKYQQISYLHQLFVRHGLTPFQLATVEYAAAQSTILTPVVAELSGEQPILIQGNDRSAYCQRNGIEQIDCLLARNVSVALPSNQRVAVRHMLIGDRTLSTHDRFGADIDRDYRHIELASHYPSITLI